MARQLVSQQFRSHPDICNSWPRIHLCFQSDKGKFKVVGKVVACKRGSVSVQTEQDELSAVKLDNFKYVNNTATY